MDGIYLCLHLNINRFNYYPIVGAQFIVPISVY
jgi:hypothetical protein